MLKRIIYFTAITSLLVGCGAKDPTMGGNEIMAFVMCQKPAAKQLRAPSTAKFPSITSQGVSSKHEGGGVYDVHGYVDAQNAFGAMIRTNWKCNIKENNDKTWSVINFQM